MAIVATSSRDVTLSISRFAISVRNSCDRPFRARAAAAVGTLKQIECSDDACEMSDTEMPSRCSVPKVRAAMPGTPSIPFPATVIIAWSADIDSAFTG